MSTQILIVDDDACLLTALAETLRLHIGDLELETSESAMSALERVSQVDYDIIISDVRMPHMDGLTFMRQVFKVRPTTPTLLITGHGDHDLGVQALNAGAYAFIHKPIDRAYFIAWVKRALQLRELSREVEIKTRLLERHAKTLEQAVLERTDALQQNEERLRMLLESTGVIPWEADARTWLFTYIGVHAETLLGYPVEQWYEKDFWIQHIHPDDRDTAVEYCLVSSRDKSHYAFQYRMIAADGRIVWIHDIVSVVKQGDVLARLRGVMLDITERKDAEQRIQRLNEELQCRVQEFETLINTAPIGIGVATDPGCNEIWGNPEFTRMLRTGREENLSKSAPNQDLPFKILRDGQEVKPEDLPMQVACRENREVLDQELEIIRSDGSSLYELARASPLLDAEGKIRGCIAAFLDITDRKRTDQALRESEEQSRKRVVELETLRTILQEKLHELETFHDIAVDRELKMIQLKRGNEQLQSEIQGLKGSVMPGMSSTGREPRSSSR
jgi:PAS domain S-box-containing protein